MSSRKAPTKILGPLMPNHSSSLTFPDCTMVLVAFTMSFPGLVSSNSCLMSLMAATAEALNGDNDDDVEFTGRLPAVTFLAWPMGWIEKKVVSWCFTVGRRKEIRVSISAKTSKGGIKHFVIRIMKRGRDAFFRSNRTSCWSSVRCSSGSAGLNGSMRDKLTTLIV